MASAAIYCRVSTRQQAEDGTSLASQERACKRLAGERGYAVSKVFAEDWNGSELQRPGLDELREGIKAGRFQAVICYATDRLSRSPIHLALVAEECQRHEVALVFVTEPLDTSPEGQLLTFVRGWAAQLEKAKILDRTSRGKASRMASGKLPQGAGRAGAPYGYRYNKATGQREIEAGDAVLVQRMFELASEGWSANRIADTFNREGLRSPLATAWHDRSVRFILANPIYVGRTFHNRTKRQALGGKRVRYLPRPQEEWTEIPGATPALVDQDLFDRVQRQLARVKTAPVLAGATFLLQGFIRCSCGGSVCGTKMRGGHNQTAVPYRYYRCLSTVQRPGRPRTCNGKHVRAELLETKVWAMVREVLENPEILLEELRRRSGSSEALENEIATLKATLKTLDARKQRMVKLYSFGEVDDALISREMKQLNKLTQDAQDTLNGLEGRRAHLREAEPLAARVTAYCRRVASRLDDFGYKEKREALEALQVRVTLNLDHSLSLYCVVPADEPDVDPPAAGYVSGLRASA